MLAPDHFPFVIYHYQLSFETWPWAAQMGNDKWKMINGK